MLLEGKSVAIIITMLVMGILLGFVGAGGAGFIIAILTLVFHIPIHVALATSLTANGVYDIIRCCQSLP